MESNVNIIYAEIYIHYSEYSTRVYTIIIYYIGALTRPPHVRKGVYIAKLSWV